jgi:hypothetical protein
MFGTAVYLVDVNGNVISTFPVAGSSTITGPLGRSADAASVSSALSTEDVAILNALLTTTIFTGRIGEVQASPTANTVLDRLKTLATLLNGGLPAALGQSTMANSLRVVLPSDQSAIPINLQPTTSGGSTPYVNLDLGTTGQVVKNGAGQVYNYYLYNNAATTRYVKFYDKGTAPTSGDTPVWTLGIPAGSAANVAFPNGIAFASGISLRGTTLVANNDNTAPSANDLVVNLGYK